MFRPPYASVVDFGRNVRLKALVAKDGQISSETLVVFRGNIGASSFFSSLGSPYRCCDEVSSRNFTPACRNVVRALVGLLGRSARSKRVSKRKAFEPASAALEKASLTGWKTSLRKSPVCGSNSTSLIFFLQTFFFKRRANLRHL